MSYMESAIEEATEGIKKGEGGPFGAVIVRNGVIVGKGHNRVLLNKDPTCHGEMEAIRDACRNLNTYDLSDCEIYTTAEPCPMCLGGILWANIKKVYTGCDRKDTASIGFRDDKFYNYIEGKEDLLETQEVERENCLELFESYKKIENRQTY